MKNTAKLHFKTAKSGHVERIKITFKNAPCYKTAAKLKGKDFTPSKSRKIWTLLATDDFMLRDFTNLYYNILQNSKVNLGLNGLGAAYIPANFVCPLLDTITPDSMDYEIHIAIRKIKQEIGSFSDYLCKKLRYTPEQLCKSLSAEQMDAVVLAIYNIEKKGQGMIVGDQTGIGKGRVAAAMIRYGHYAGKKPIFLSEKPNLFSDIYRDLVDIGSEKLVPFIINSREGKTHVKDRNGNIVYEALQKSEQQPILEHLRVPGKFDYFMATYSQFNSPESKPVKPNFLASIARNNIIIMDEAHNASGSSNTGAFIQQVLASTLGVTFLSATFAKRPDNMPVYAMKTALSDANLDNDKLVDAIVSGGVALQEVLSSQLVAEGQMIRRERSFEGVEVNYITINEKATEHGAIADNITSVLRDIIKFQKEYIDELVSQDDDILKAEYKEVEKRRGTKAAGVDSTPVFSKVFNLINQMLFSIKAESVADKAIERLKEGKKPVIAFASTMGSFLDYMENENGNPVSSGDIISADFKEVMTRALRGVMRYTVTTPQFNEDKGIWENDKEYKYYDVSELSPDGQGEYRRIANKITTASTGISISPIDVVVSKIKQAGYTTGEVTGRKMEVLPVKGKKDKGLVMTRKRINVNDAFRQYNNNEVDCLLINQSGATGASAHAIVTDIVPSDKVKQRVMIILQAELDINKEVQKRGRINRTGQIMLPIYDYMNSAIPAEQRLMMMLQKKLKSLDANTTSNQKQSSKILDTPDFLNKYGDKVVTTYLQERTELNELLGDPLKFETTNKPQSDGKVTIIEGAAHKVSGRVAIMPSKDQATFYREILDLYEKQVLFLKQTDQYDLEVETLNLEAEIIEKDTAVAGKGGKSAFGQDSFLEKCRVNNLRKPFSQQELVNLINKSLQGADAETLQDLLKQDHQKVALERANAQINDQQEKYKGLIENIVNEKGYLKIVLTDTIEQQNYYDARVEELNTAKQAAVKKVRQVANNRFMHLDRIFKFFLIGKGYDFPEQSEQIGEQTIKCVFLGYQIDSTKANPYAPSAVSLRFAVANSIKYLVLAASGEQGEKIMSIVGLNAGVRGFDAQSDTIVSNWTRYVKSFSNDKAIRYIVTGNVLQAFSKYKGKLVSYTTNDNSTQKGILMPDSWNPDKVKGSDFVSVPIAKAKSVIKGLTSGNTVYDSERKLGISRSWGDYILTVPSNRNYKRIYTDKDLIELTDNTRDGFVRISGMMRANIDISDIEAVIDILQNKYSQSVEVAKAMFEKFVEKTKSSVVKQDVIAKAEKQLAADRKIHSQKIKVQNQKPPKESTISISEKQKFIAIAKAKLALLKLVG